MSDQVVCDKAAVLAAEVREIASWVESWTTSDETPLPPQMPEEVEKQFDALCVYYMTFLPFFGPLVTCMIVGKTMFEAGVRYGKALAALGEVPGPLVEQWRPDPDCQDCQGTGTRTMMPVDPVGEQWRETCPCVIFRRTLAHLGESGVAP